MHATIEPRQVRRRSFLNETNKQALCLLAPAGGPLDGFQNVIYDRERYQSLLSEAQRLRGRVYLDDGAISADDLDSQQCYVVKDDSLSWHILLRDSTGLVVAVSRMLFFSHSNGPVPIDKLHAAQLIERTSELVRAKYLCALQQFASPSCDCAPYFVECGGLAIASEMRASRNTSIFLSTYWALSRFIGAARGVGAATERNSSADILRRFGGFSIPTQNGGSIEPFYDSVYDCMMELQGFASDILDPTLEPTVQDIQEFLPKMIVFVSSDK